jgi:hypothetical protein
MIWLLLLAQTDPLRLPARPSDALPGSKFAEKVKALSPAKREDAIRDEILRGNVPDFLRTFREVTLADGGRRVTIRVLPDYLAVGSDADFLRIPMTPRTAQAIADKTGCVLPTRKIVDAVYESATVRLTPKPMTKERESVATFLEHQRLIEEQRAGRKPGELTAGHKKDVVITNRLKEKPDRVAIYGWHQPGGKPIQSLTIVHGECYVDYSHGIRLVRDAAKADGKDMKVADILRSDALHATLSDEGRIDTPRYDE